jgi:DNA uptake protein ComE-like DNA-binding protein
MRRSIFAAALLLTVAPLSARAQAGKNLSNILEPNLATREQLLTLPGATPAIADAIVRGRPYADMLAVDRAVTAAGLNAEQKQALYRRLFMPINLNAATREEIMLVPGAGTRMTREFLEYRPYVAMAQFRREIGKYVNAEEVARLEQYVFIPIDLNKATDDDILSIPGVGQRMLREFKEYRPWRTIDQFRREIGKYVDRNELARLERYVIITP